MRKQHRFTYFCTLLLPIGAVAGAGLGAVIGFPVVSITLGVAAAMTGSYALVRHPE